MIICYVNDMFVYCVCAFVELPAIDRWQHHAENKKLLIIFMSLVIFYK